MCNSELTYLDLHFNALKCHLVRIRDKYGSKCHNLIIIISSFISERELMFTFAICRRPSVCRLSSVVCRLSVCNVRAPYSARQPIENFGNVSAPFNTMVT